MVSVSRALVCTCLTGILCYLLQQELGIVTDYIVVKNVIPTKRSVVFNVLKDPKNVPKLHPLCVNVTDISKVKDEKGQENLQYVSSERISLLGFSHPLTDIIISFPVNQAIVNGEIHHNLSLYKGLLVIQQRWILTEAEKDDGILLKDYFQFTTRQFLARFVKKQALNAHKLFVESIKEYCVSLSKNV